MTLDKIRGKLIRRLTSPVEIVYDVTRHWFLLLLMLTLGTLVMFTKVGTEAPVYECTATLNLVRNKVVVDPQSPGMIGRDESEGTFIQEQISILQSDGVIERAVRAIGFKDVFLQEKDPLVDRSSGRLRAFTNEMVLLLDKLMEMVERQPVGTADAQNLERAKTLFRKRIFIKPEPRGNIVKIGIYGTYPDFLRQDLDRWIQSYRSRLEDMNSETYDRFFTVKAEEWGTKEKEAKRLLDDFKAEKKGVNQKAYAMNEEAILRLRILIDDLRRQQAIPSLGAGRLGMELAGQLSSGAARSEKDDPLAAWKAAVQALAVEISMLEGKVGEKNPKLLEKREQLRKVEESIAGKLGMEGPAAADGSHNPLEEQVQRLTKELDALVDKQVGMEQDLATLNHHTEDHRRAEEFRRKYEDLVTFKKTQTEKLTDLDIQFIDKPTTSNTPVGKSPFLKIGAGSLAGIALGFFMAFGLEFVCPRVRFKRDIEDEFGLKVLVVVPKN